MIEVPLLSVLVVIGTVPSERPDDAVRTFYSYIIAHRPLGIPTGENKKALWPLNEVVVVRTESLAPNGLRLRLRFTYKDPYRPPDPSNTYSGQVQ